MKLLTPISLTSPEVLIFEWQKKKNDLGHFESEESCSITKDHYGNETF